MPLDYTPHNWEANNLITKEALNNLEKVGTYVSGLNKIAETGEYADLQNAPKNLSDFINDTKYQTKDDVLAALQEAGTSAKWYSGSALDGTEPETDYSSPTLMEEYHIGDYYLNSNLLNLVY